MKLYFEKDTLLNSLNIASKAISTRTTNPIQECILFDASEDNIRLIGNDSMEIGIETVVKGEIVEKGKIALDSKIIIDIIRKLEVDNDKICISVDESLMTTISCGKVKYNIPGLDGEEYSYLPQIERTNYIKLSQLTLKDTIRQTIFSAAINDSNKILCGECLNVKENILKLTALDGYRIAIRNILLKDNYNPATVILPAKSLNEISRIIAGDSEKEITIYFGTNHVLFEFGETIVTSRIIDGEFFKLDDMLSSDYETKVYINRLKLLNALDSSTILIRESDHKPIIVDIKDAIMHLSAKSLYGAFDVDLECIKTGKDIKIAFNPRFLMDAIKVIEDEYLNIYLSNSKSPCFIKDAEENYEYIVLPVNFVEE